MATSKKIELEDTIRDAYDLVQESGSTRADMEETLDKIANLFTDALPDLDSEDSDEAEDIESDDDE